jgi:ABC-type Fe3+-hydroxamate transport system substrate-binding protein
VLVLHFPFENAKQKRSGNEKDVANLKECFEGYKNCEFRALTPNEPIEDVLSQIGLENIFSSSAERQAEGPSNPKKQKLANPDVFILIILSHGDEDGFIESDNPPALQEKVCKIKHSNIKYVIITPFMTVLWDVVITKVRVQTKNISPHKLA